MKSGRESTYVWRAVPLLFASGLCALLYQVVWLREMRLIFGSSTAATGMVLAIFMGGLGCGAAYFGRLADRVSRPLALYGFLELGIGVSVAFSPLLLGMARHFYIDLGGVQTLGLLQATMVRFLLAALILLIPTFLMGGTLPVAAKAVEAETDCGRRDLALLYGFNTMGGMLGVAIATFVLLEALGNRATLWSGCLVNMMVGVAACLMAGQGKMEWRAVIGRRRPMSVVGMVAGEGATASVMPAGVIYAAAFVTGFVFLLMELVWYRMLAPILGGSTYTFGLILAMALLGIGIGGALFGSRGRSERTNISAFTLTCGLEAFCMAIPFAMGDRLAVMTAVLNGMGNGGFGFQVLIWAIVTAVVVLPAAIIAGVQFPMLIGLLGSGGRRVGEHTGYVYAWNTAGAIVGSIAGGFGLIPLLTAPGCWQMAALALSLVAVVVMLFGRRLGKIKWPAMVAGIVIVAGTGLLLLAAGPTAAWRHSSIGAGRVDLSGMGRNEVRGWLNNTRAMTIWEREGVESSVAMQGSDGLSFVINGKPDGNATGDAGTQIMGPLVGAILHPAPQRAMVIGLGSGSSGGWLAGIDTMEQVDVVELEPAILEVARRCSPVNRRMLENPKVRILIGDGREVLQTSHGQYDLIFSEPSNPYRAGIASLYTREFYQAAEERLAVGGIFSQWVQAYYIDYETVRAISATLASVFADVELWMTTDGDILFVCSREAKDYVVPVLQQRLAAEPFRSAMRSAWGVEGLDGFLAAFLAGNVFTRELRGERVNTDDRMLVEFGFARAAGREGLFSVGQLRSAAVAAGDNRPPLTAGRADWQRVDLNYLLLLTWFGQDLSAAKGLEPALEQRFKTFADYRKGDFAGALSGWRQQGWHPVQPLELALAAESLADEGSGEAWGYVLRLQREWPAVADAILARYYWRIGNHQDAYSALDRALKGFRAEAWQIKDVMVHAIDLAVEMAGNRLLARRIFELLGEPFAVYNLERQRWFSLMQVGSSIDCAHGIKALSVLEPFVPWEEDLLRYRLRCYQEENHPLTTRAVQDLQEYLQ